MLFRSPNFRSGPVTVAGRYAGFAATWLMVVCCGASGRTLSAVAGGKSNPNIRNKSERVTLRAKSLPLTGRDSYSGAGPGKTVGTLLDVIPQACEDGFLCGYCLTCFPEAGVLSLCYLARVYWIRASGSCASSVSSAVIRQFSTGVVRWASGILIRVMELARRITGNSSITTL